MLCNAKLVEDLMRYFTLVLAAALATTASLAIAARPGSLGEAGRHRPHVSVPPGSLSEAPSRHRGQVPQLSPHFGLPGISGFPLTSEHAPRLSPHIGLPGISGF